MTTARSAGSQHSGDLNTRKTLGEIGLIGCRLYQNEKSGGMLYEPPRRPLQGPYRSHGNASLRSLEPCQMRRIRTKTAFMSIS